MKKIITCLLLMIGLVGCQTSKPNNDEVDSSSQYPMTIIDQVGREVTIEKEPERIISGYYISTSLLIGLGEEHHIVGVENQADKRQIYHQSAPQLLDLDGLGTVKTFDLEKAVTLNPDLIILPFKLKSIAESIEQLNIPVIYVMPESEAQLTEMIELVSKVTNNEQLGSQMIKFISDEINYMKDCVKDNEKPKVYLSGNSSLLMTCSSKMYQHCLIENANGINVASEIEDTYWAEVSYEHILRYNPDYIILASDATYSVDDVLNDPYLQGINAIKNKKVYQIPGDLECIDSPVPAGFLGQLWLASTLHSESYSEQKYQEVYQEYYETFYNIQP